MRRSSWELAAKCLGQAAVPVDWMPWVRPAAMRPARIGSSDKYSKLRPHRGERLMFRPGPSRTLTPSPRASVPNASPIWRARSGFHVAASAEAVGKQVAFSESAMPRWSASPSWRRTPWGPSLMMKEGTCAVGMAREFQSLAPERRAAACRRVRLLAFVSAVCCIVVSCLSCSIAGVVAGSSVGYVGVVLPIECVVCCFLGLLCGVSLVVAGLPWRYEL